MTLINRQGIYSSIVALLLLALYPSPLWGSGVGETNTVALVRHAPTINGGTIEGSLQQLTGEGATLNSGTLISGDWWVPGTPTVRTNGRPQFAGILPGAGSPTPTGYSITLNGNVTLGYLRTRTDPATLSTVTAPPQPAGTRSVTITSSNQSIGDPATLRNLTLNGNVGQIVVPPGTYGNFTVNGGSGLTLGISGTTQPVIYNLQNLTLNGQSRLDVVGPIVLTVANGFTANGMVGTTNHASWLQLRVASGGFTLNGGCTVHGQIVVPAGTVIVNGNSRLIGTVQCDRLIINSGGCIIAGGSGGTTNQPPTASNQNLTTPEDTALPITLTGSDPEGAPLTYTVLSWPSHGTLDPPLANTNRFTYSPAANYIGSDSFTFKVNDGQTNSLPATVSITITPVNDAPVPAAQNLTTPEDTALPITLTGSDPEGAPLTYTVLSWPSHGTLDPPLANTNRFTYSPAANYIGSDSFTFKVNDGQTNSLPATVSITITPVNDAPVPVAQNLTTPEDTALPIVLTGSDPEGAPLTFTVVSGPTNGVLSGVAPSLIYLPNTNYNGPDAFSFTVSDGSAISVISAVNITVTPVNDAPELWTVEDYHVMEGSLLSITNKATDIDLPANTLVFSLTNAPSGMTIDATNGLITWTPTEVQGPSTNLVTVVVTDNGAPALSDSKSFTVVVTEVNTAPVLAAIADQTIAEGATLVVTNSATDIDLPASMLVFSLTNAPSGMTIDATNGLITWTPTEAQGPSTNLVTVVVTDNGTPILSDSKTFTLVVTAVNDAPFITAPAAVSVAEDTVLSFSGTNTIQVSDVDAGDGLLRLSLSVSNGVLWVSATNGIEWLSGTNGTDAMIVTGTLADLNNALTNLTYLGATNYYGSDSLILTVDDQGNTGAGGPMTAIQTILITVTPVNDAPIAQSQSLSSVANTPLSITLAGTDIDGDAIEFQIANPPTNGVLTGTAPNLVYTPNPNYTGPDSFIFIVNDGQTDSMPATVDLMITQAAIGPRVFAGENHVLVQTFSTVLKGQATDVDLPPGNSLSLTWTVVNQPAGASVNFADCHDPYSAVTFSALGAYHLRLTADDGRANASADVYFWVVPIPPDPALVAPPLDRTEPTSLMKATEFLYRGSNPTQFGVVAGTIVIERAAVIRGRVLDQQGNALPGVGVTVLGCPEYGATATRTDGRFELGVNGGGPLTVNFEKPGLLTAQRRIEVAWQRYVSLRDVVLTAYDPAATIISMNAPTMQSAAGSLMFDADGSRQAWILFPPGLTAEMELPGSLTVTLPSLTVRATEYTVGTNGPNAMPAELPPSSGYTYCVELSADEAIAAEAEMVRFNQPVLFYVENFLSFPTGTKVPVGYYDRQRGCWVPAPNGRVIKILDIDGGQAVVAVDGSGTGASLAQLEELEITSAELASLAGRYQVGQSLWRTQIAHFTPQDLNWGFYFNGFPGPALLMPTFDIPTELPDYECGSIMDIQNQVLGEELPLAGMPFGLCYSSDRVPGLVSSRQLQIPIRANESLPYVQRIIVSVSVAGQEWEQSFGYANTVPYQTVTFTWDGKDGYGRFVQGEQKATVRVGYAYKMYYVDLSDGGSLASFFMAIGYPAVPFPSLVSRLEAPPVVVWQSYQQPLRYWDTRDSGIGGWTLKECHTYVPEQQTLVMGDGSRRSALSVNTPVRRISSVGAATVVAAPDGSVVFSDNQAVVWRRSRDGATTVVVGGGNNPPTEGALATNVWFEFVNGLAIGPDNSVYCATVSDGRIWKIGSDGRLRLVAGEGTVFNNNPEDPGIPIAMAVGPDASLFFCDCTALRRVGTDGVVTTVAGDDATNTADHIPAREAALWAPGGLAIAPEGDIYVGDASGIHRISRDGIISRIGSIENADALALAPNHSLYVVTHQYVGAWMEVDGVMIYITGAQFHIVELKPDGRTIRIAGADLFEGYVDEARYDGVGALSVPLRPYSMAVGPDNSIYYGSGDYWDAGALWRIAGPLPGLSQDNIAITSTDGSELYIFTGTGKHLRTIDTLTGNTRYEFTYDLAGRLTAITDTDRDVTMLERDALTGRATAIVSPDGHRTTLGYDPNGWLNRVSNPANETFAMSYTSDGMLTQFTNPRQKTTVITYDSLGQLQQETDAVGGFRTFTRTETGNGSAVSVTTAMLNHPATYTVARLTNNIEYHENVARDGSTNRTWIAPTGTTTIQQADNTISIFVQGPDPRWGFQAPLAASRQVVLPSGNQMTSTQSLAVELADPDNPLSLTALTNTVTLNGRTFQSIYRFDGLHRSVDTYSPAGRTSVSILDDKGRVTQSVVPNIAPMHYQYDTRGRLQAVSQTADGQTRAVTFTYDQSQNGGPSSGRLMGITDSLNRTTTFAYDPNLSGRVIRQILPNGRFVQFLYDANGNLTGITPPSRPVHGYAYTPVDLVSDYIPPDVGAGNNFTHYAYNADGQLTRVVRPDRLTINLGYDFAGRLETLATPLGETTYFYDGPSCGCAGSDNPSAILTPDAIVLSYRYDGPLLTNTEWIGPVTGQVSRVFDNNWRLIEYRVNGVNPVNYGYDDDGLLTQAGSLVLTRDPQNGFLAGTSLGNLHDSWQYNGYGERASYLADYGATPVYAYSFLRDQAGQIVAKTETILGITDTYAYAYDALGQLTNVTKNGQPFSIYVYDENGNRVLDQRVTDSGPQTTVYEVDAQDRLLACYTPDATNRYAYTDNGELYAKTEATGTTQYTYDVLGNLRTVVLPTGTRIDYVIDGANRRIGKKVNGVLVQGWLYQDSLKPIAELNAAGAVVSRFVYAGRPNVPEYLVKGGVTYRLVLDHLGSVRLVVNIASGQVAQRLDYDEYGRVLLDTNPGFQPFGFDGGLYDSDTKLVRFGTRDYDAEIGRWLNRDPIGEEGGINLYAYVDNSPINAIDPFGLDPRSDLLGAIGSRDPESIQLVLETWGDAISPALRNRALEKIKQIAAQKAKQETERILAEQMAKKALEKKLKTKCGDLIQARLKRVPNYPSQLEGKTYEEIMKMTSEEAKLIQKLLTDSERLMEKVATKPK